MPRMKRRPEEEQQGLNLAPIMNIMMILIPLLLASSSFVLVSALNVNSPRNAQSSIPDEQQDTEEIPVPRVLVAVSESGFTITDMRQSPAFAESQLGCPLTECGGCDSVEPGSVAITICNRPGTDGANTPLLERLNYRGLYNRLVAIRNHPSWTAQWNADNALVNLLADKEIPFDVIVRTMDVARFLLEEDSYTTDEVFWGASYRADQEDEDTQFARLFPSPVLLLPRASAD